MRTLVSVVVPLYDEHENVAPLVDKIKRVFEQLPDHDYECLLVNDGSTDGTRDAIERQAAETPEIRPVHLVENCGQSAALVAGMRRARGEYILMIELRNVGPSLPKMVKRTSPSLTF